MAKRKSYIRRPKGQLRKNIFNTLNVGSVGMTGGIAWKSAGVGRIASTGEGMGSIRKGKKPKFGDFSNLGM